MVTSRRSAAAALWLPTVLLLGLLASGDANVGGGGSGSNKPNNNDNNGSESSSPSSNGEGQPRYSLSQQLSFDPRDESLSISAETESMAFYDESTAALKPEDEAGREEEQSAPSSSANDVLQATASVYTSDALLCSGGDQPPPPPSDSFVAMAECRFGASMDIVDSDLEDEDSDDDDDDDDDGHSSMLSNASLRRARASANGASSDGGRASPYNGKSDAGTWRSAGGSSHPSFVGRGGSPPNKAGRGVRLLSAPFARGRSTTSTRRNRHATSPLSSVLSVRGGAVATAAATAKDPNELARRLLVAALVTILYEVALGHLLEFAKIVMQTSPPGTTYGDVMRSITGEKGIAGVWDGFVPWGVVQATMKGGVFGLAHAMASSYLIPLAEEGKLSMHLAQTLAGGIGGLFQGYVLSPTLLLKTRVMTNDAFREKMSLIRSTYLSLRIGFDVVKDEGLPALMKGSNVFATKRLFDWATRFFFSDMVEAILLRFSTTGSLTPAEKIAASLMGGTLSTFSTLPLDVLVAKSQDAKKAGVPTSAWNMFKQELDEKGWKGLAESYMNGFEARLAHVCLTTVVMKTGAPILYDFMYKKD